MGCVDYRAIGIIHVDVDIGINIYVYVYIYIYVYTGETTQNSDPCHMVRSLIA